MMKTELLNCGSCIFNEHDCKYKELKKCIDNDIYEREVEDVLMLKCSLHKCKKPSLGMDSEEIEKFNNKKIM